MDNGIRKDAETTIRTFPSFQLGGPIIERGMFIVFTKLA